jgi:hypothetical protein
MSDGRQALRALAIGVLAVALVLGLTRLVTDLWVLLVVALVLQALLIADRVWRGGGQHRTRRQQADWDAEWDKAWAEQDAQPMRLAASFGPAPAGSRMPGMPRMPGMSASSEPFSIMAALSAAHDVLEQCPGWRVVSVQAAGQDGTPARYDLIVRDELTGTIRALHSEQEWAAFRREMRVRGHPVLQPGSGHGDEPQAR